MIVSPEQVIHIAVFIPISTCTIIVFTFALLYHILLGNSSKYRQHLPTLHYKESTFSRFLLERIPRLQSPYYPPLWATNPNVQAILMYFFLPYPEVRYERQYLQLKDRGLVALDWAVKSDYHTRLASVYKKHKRLLLLLPNVADTAITMGDTTLQAMRRGFQPIVYNRRGYGQTPLSTPKLQPYGDPSDLRQAIKYIKAQYPQAYLTVIGYGTGADLLLAYLGEYGSSAYLSAAVAISPLYDPERIYEDGLPKLHDFLRLLVLRRLLSNHFSALSKMIDVKAALASRSVSEFEKLVFWKMCNCDNWEQYWEKNAPLRDADEMSVPLLCISSKDDPLVPEEAIPYDVFHVYPQLVLATTKRGGHCCFLQAGTFRPHSWADSLALDFLIGTLEFSFLEEGRTKRVSR